MKIYILTLIMFLCSFDIFSQNDTLYILIEKPFFVKNNNDVYIGFGIKSKDKKFNLDYYQFKLLNFNGWDDKGNDIFLDIDELKNSIDLKDINYKTPVNLSNEKKWWEIHDFLSLKNKIYIIFKGNSNKNFFSIPVIYLHTKKNFVPTDLSKTTK